MSEGYAPGTVLDKYRLEEIVGRGGMGIVVAAKHRVLRRRVAIKLLAGTGSDSARRRLVREAKAAQALSSEYVVAVHDVVDDGETPYIVMELLAGENVAELLARRGRLPVSEAVDLVLQAACGLADAHDAGVIHRDVKPSNLFLARQPDGGVKVKLLDFGISKTEFEGEAVSDATAATSLLGSPHFMSPEQMRDPRKVDARTDLWSLAVTLFTLLSGERPFEGRTVLEISAAIVADPHPSLRAKLPDLPEGLERAIDRALAKRPAARTASVREFAAEIAPFASESSHALVARLAMPRDDVPPSLSPMASACEPLDPTATDETAGSTRGAAISKRTSRRWSRIGASIAAVLSLGLATYLIGLRDRPSSAPPVIAPASTTDATPVNLATETASPRGPVAPVASEPRAERLAAEAAPKRAPRAKPIASTTAAAPPAKAKAAVDIDGIPIVE